MSTYPEIILVGNLYQLANEVYPGFTNTGTHVPGSWHYRNGGSAVDWDDHTKSGWPHLDGMAAYFYHWSGLIVELFSTKPGTRTGHYVKNGVRRSYSWASANGLTTVSESQNHIHVAVATVTAAQEMLTRATQKALGLTEDGVKGPKTTAAIKAVQHQSGIATDGVVGTKTVAAIREHNHWAPTHL